MAPNSYNVGGNNTSTDVKPSATSRKPDNTAFKQQRLPAWQPILTPKSVLPVFFGVSLLFIPLGIVFLLTSNSVEELSFPYTNCLSTSGQQCSDLRSNVSRMLENCTCLLNFTIDHEIKEPIFVYYGLSNYFQNHRRYVKSRDDSQLIGNAVNNQTVGSDCAPFDVRPVDGQGNLPIAPCGAIANSFFNDSFSLTAEASAVSIDQTGIAWNTDHTIKFKNPTTPDTDNLTVKFASYAMPYFWNKRVEELDPNNINNNGYKNEAFEVWMRTAAFPTFRKLYGRISTNLIPDINYTIEIEYRYPVASFSGTKRFILSTTSWLGGKNSFLGIAYIAVGSISFIVGIALSVLHICFSTD